MFIKSSPKQAKQFGLKAFKDPAIRRQLEMLPNEDVNALNKTEYQEVNNIHAKANFKSSKKFYSKPMACLVQKTWYICKFFRFRLTKQLMMRLLARKESRHFAC